jgi:hypothetical protein
MRIVLSIIVVSDWPDISVSSEWLSNIRTRVVKLFKSGLVDVTFHP